MTEFMSLTIGMSPGKIITDHKEIQEWVEERGGRPTMVEGTMDGDSGLLRIDFGEKDENLKEVSWDDFFKVFDERNLGFLCSPEKESRFFKFVQREGS